MGRSHDFVKDSSAFGAARRDAEAQNAVLDTGGNGTDASAGGVESPNSPFGGESGFAAMFKSQLDVGFADLGKATLAPLEQQCAGVVGVFPAIALHVGEMHEQEPRGLGDWAAIQCRYPEGCRHGTLICGTLI